MDLTLLAREVLLEKRSKEAVNRIEKIRQDTKMKKEEDADLQEVLADDGAVSLLYYYCLDRNSIKAPKSAIVYCFCLLLPQVIDPDNPRPQLLTLPCRLNNYKLQKTRGNERLPKLS